MPETKQREEQFLNALKDVFVGAKVEGDSGYINLMKIKARYFENGVFPTLKKDIDEACKAFDPAFREELFDKLYDFFHRYFSESGSIYFRHTPLHSNVYEKVYTDDRDVMLFWKTHMLYYVKTDRLFKNMDVEVDGIAFYFDASEMEHKQANEKRAPIYAYKEYKKGKVVLAVEYKEGNRKTKVEEIGDALAKKNVDVGVETLEKAFRVFEKQSEVDYFINKNAKAFLKEQFDLWLYQYVFVGEAAWTEMRLKELQALKRIAYCIIDFIAQFEDELVKVWNKPKFVLNSHYIVTLDKITDSELLKKILSHDGMKAQVREWKDLGIVERGFKPTALDEKNVLGELAHAEYQYLPLDTRYFPDLELEILELFDDLEAALDGWLIHSENYQALKTHEPKLRQKGGCIYIDPPYNAKESEILYANDYKDSSWLSMIDSRVALARDSLCEDGVLCATIDDYEVNGLRFLLDGEFSSSNYLATVVIRNNPSGRSTVRGFAVNHEYALFYANDASECRVGRLPHTEAQRARYAEVDEDGIAFEWENLRKSSRGSERKDRPKQFYPLYYDEAEQQLRVPPLEWHDDTKSWSILEQQSAGEKTIYPLDEFGRERVWSFGVVKARREAAKMQVRKEGDDYQVYKKKPLQIKGVLPRTWWSKPSYSARDNGTRALKDLFGPGVHFDFPKSVFAVEDCLTIAGLEEHDLCLDFFAGSGTTGQAVINLSRQHGTKRKYILVEMSEYFSAVLVPRVKKVVFSDRWRDGKARDGKGISHFCKYYDLEQYEDTVRRAHYEDAPLLKGVDPYNQYVFLRDEKMLDAITIDREKDKVEVHLEKLYKGIDIAETLSCVMGKGIKRITKDTVEFQDGTSESLTSPDWKIIKPLVWW